MRRVVSSAGSLNGRASDRFARCATDSFCERDLRTMREFTSLLPWIVGVMTFLIVWILIDIGQRQHAIIHNFPIVGHFRYWLESIGPELRQYIVTSNNEERPFSRDQRSWIYASSKKQNNYFGFGTDNDLERDSSRSLSVPNPK